MQESQKRSLDFLPQIDGLRFVAVFCVMIFHWASQNFGQNFILINFPFGTGVNLFFVISGFLITYILLNKKDDICENRSSFWKEIKNFYVKRTLRIFPIYYILIGVLCVFSYQDIKDFLIYLLTYTVNWFMVFKNVFIGHKTHLWSLAVEEQFYLIWPFLIFMVPKRGILSLIILAILTSILSKIYFMYYSPYPMGVNGATLSCFDSLGLGALIAFIQKKRVLPFTPILYKILLAASIVIYVLLFIKTDILNQSQKLLFFNFGTSVVFFFVVMIAANNGFTGGVKAFLENKMVLFLGKISYGLYLYHNFASELYFSGVNSYFPSFRGDFDLFVMYFLLITVVSTISWYVIERPILNFKKYFQ